MSLQARMSQNDPRLYSANRDVAHNFDFVVMEVARRVEANGWKELDLYAQVAGVSDTTLGAACQSLCLHVLGCVDRPKESMAQSLVRAGWFDLPEAARVIVMAHLGSIVLGMHWAGVREATLGGKGPVLTYQNLVAFGRTQAELMRMSRGRRWWYKLKLKAARVWAAFRGDTRDSTPTAVLQSFDGTRRPAAVEEGGGPGTGRPG